MCLLCVNSFQDKTTIIISSASESGLCGIFPKVGERWLLYAYGTSNSFSTNLCTRTKSMEPKAWDFNEKEIRSDLVFLENKNK
jgi:hypothetical protein